MVPRSNQRPFFIQSQGFHHPPMPPSHNNLFTNFSRQTTPRQLQPRGGLLAKIFGKSNNPIPSTPVNPFQFGRQSMANLANQQTTSNLLSFENISKFLGQTQQVLRTVQQVGPMVQQYGPIIKNLPALWKLYRGLSADNTDSETETTELDLENNLENNDDKVPAENEFDIQAETNVNQQNFQNDKLDEHPKNPPIKKQNKEGKKQKQLETKPSVPKLYI
ncbi:VrrA/YqfQ family protein [Bacillus kwashiorkori]|uniref:VrrA/YqfQ family protein n=1 Tax=Bacillus kwashiorkori TaxID=1522318 RepID=UPI0007822DFA|nr:VrrA/YqfQ family protein [Bacillus kwashiorkori]